MQPSTTPERAVVVEVDSDDELDALRSACRTAGITARWDSLRPDQAAEISHLITQHGIDALVRHAAAHQRSERPTLYVQGWIGSWQMLTAPRTDVPAGPTACTDCDHGWLDADALVACPTCRPNLARRAS
ncbi:hypothetical protein DW322_01045 [Rhodococcus rhodnii]|uniref:Uncharacterized protein n=1 Tax=Rhodococcus rhodnii TaxID=38312 RepID=A0A6P2C8N1_9NOCA|nr:hypothetical protein DW322_21560 [Rhodococcus rhodnii]TXG89089.1 hypothetical protein DW322_01045 [Rhodococcus rhodnii]